MLKIAELLFNILRCLRYTLNLYSFSLFYSKAFQLIKSGIKYNGLCFTGKVHNFNIIAYRENIRMLQRENLLLSIFRKMVKKQWISPTLWHLWNFHGQCNELNGTNNWWTRFYPFFAINGYVFAKSLLVLVTILFTGMGVDRKKYFFPGFNLVIYSNN